MVNAYFFRKIGFDISCKLSLLETICINGQCLFSGVCVEGGGGGGGEKIEHTEFAQRVIKFKEYEQDTTKPI